MRLEFHAHPLPCRDVEPRSAPALYLDAGGALRWFDGRGGLIVFPFGTVGTTDEAAHRRGWNPATCRDLANGVTIRPVPGHTVEDDPDRITRAWLMADLDAAPPGNRRRLIAAAVIDSGGTYPLRAGQIEGAMALIDLFGIQGSGPTEAEAIEDWIAAARAGHRPAHADSAWCGKPRNHAEEIQNLLRRNEGRLEV